MNNYILIEYSNSVDFGDIVYHNTFGNKVFLKADVSKPEYELLEEGIENGDGEFEPTFQKWAKKYSIRFYAQEFQVDALTLMALHDQITITLKNGESSNASDVEVTPKWDADIECWAEVTIKFTTSYILRKGCDTNMDSGCQQSVVSALESGVAVIPQDADDGVGGEDHWDGTDPVSSGTIMFFYTALEGGSSVYTGDPLGFYQYSSTNGWELIEIENGQFGETGLTDCLFLVKSLPYYYKLPFIRSVTDDGGGDCTISCYGIGVESDFYQAQKSVHAADVWTDLGDPQLASVFNDGFQLSPTAGDWDFRIKWYTHSCEYGYSNEVNKVVT